MKRAWHGLSDLQQFRMCLRLSVVFLVFLLLTRENSQCLLPVTGNRNTRSPPYSGPCYDTICDCSSYLDLCRNSAYVTMMQEKCAMTRRFCTASSAPTSCQDSNPKFVYFLFNEMQLRRMELARVLQFSNIHQCHKKGILC